MHPIRLAQNQPPERFYLGGPQIAGFRGMASIARREPEDWIASTTSLFGEVSLGLTRLADGRLLAERIAADPVGWLGAAHVARWGADPALLVKLLDAGQRLPVHAHPSVAFSREHLGVVHGKTEAWIMLAGATAYLGFSRDVEERELADWVRTQDVGPMLGAMNTLPLAAGESVLVPAGLPHAIGVGAFLVELQEPTDQSILLEWRDFAIDGATAGHLGLGFETALAAIDRRAWSSDAIAGLRGGGPGAMARFFPAAADPFFRAERYLVTDSVALDTGYAVLVVVSGTGDIVSDDGTRTRIRGGETVLVPHAAGACSIEGVLEVVRCRPPDPAIGVER